LVDICSGGFNSLAISKKGDVLIWGTLYEENYFLVPNKIFNIDILN
jgi:hypothetical protein